VSPRAGLVSFGEQEHSYSHQDSNPKPSSPQLVAILTKLSCICKLLVCLVQAHNSKLSSEFLTFLVGSVFSTYIVQEHIMFQSHSHCDSELTRTTSL